jgi:hypothetical protein
MTELIRGNPIQTVGMPAATMSAASGDGGFFQ